MSKKPIQRRMTPYADGRIMLRAAAEGSSSPGTLVGYAAIWYDGTPGSEYRTAEWVERIRKGAFARSLATGGDVVATLNHNYSDLLGRLLSSTLVIGEDDTGLRYENVLPNTSIGRDVAELAARGDLRGSSFRFYPVAWDTGREGDVAVYTLTDVDLVELGPVTTPAYEGTSAGLRYASDEALPVAPIDEPDPRRFGIGLEIFLAENS